jgi:F0F1-type ATP synthase assembly protein I
VEDDKPNKPAKKLSAYGRYSAIGFQLAGIIGAGVLIGYELDKWLHTSPYLTLACSLLFIVAGIYVTFRDLAK